MRGSSGGGDVAEPEAEIVEPLVPLVRERGDALHRAARELDELGGRDAPLFGPRPVARRQVVRRFAGRRRDELRGPHGRLGRLLVWFVARRSKRVAEGIPVHHGSNSTCSKKRSTRCPGRTRSCSARSSSSEASPSARLTASQGRLKSSWIIIVEIRGLISITFSPMNWMLKNQSSSNSATTRSDAAMSSGASSVSKYIPSPHRT